VTDQNQSVEPQPGESLPQRGGELPRRNPRGESQPQSGGSFFERALPQRNGELPQRGESLPQRGESLPQRNGEPPQRSGGLPQRGEGLPQRGEGLPQRGEALPQRGESLPQRNGELPQRGEALPQRGESLPQRNGELPQRGNTGESVGALPRRTTRTRPSGRHRSPHRLSVASDAPALVLAVPGRADADTSEIGPRVASIAGLSCPGVDIRVGYLEGDELLVSECLQPPEPEHDEDHFPCVIVPLLLSPNPNIDAELRQLAAEPKIPAVLANHLGPHPLVAEALHTRLAEAGLARQARSAGLSISADGRGVVVLADIGEQAASAAGVAAVLLASRLSVPVVPASLGDPASIVDAVNRLTESGAPRPALAPCLIGPETNIAVLDDLSAALGAPCAPTLGAHQAIGQLVAIRYGAALASLSLAG
jgi:sirohydrochlorin ferrochelatase